MLRATGSKKDIKKLQFYSLISDIYENDSIQKLGEYKHHICTTRLQHSLNVSYYNYIICSFLGLNAVSAARAGLMHDMFYYDRKNSCIKSHHSEHPLIAARNAKKLFSTDSLENDIIIKHMWPATLRFPKYRESYVIVFVDKYCAVLEFLAPKYHKIKNTLNRKKQSI
ncbi:MAG: HAD family hydrolase [Porcipelethomonas sp.]